MVKKVTVEVQRATKLVEKDSGWGGDHSDPYVVVLLRDEEEDGPDLRKPSYFEEGYEVRTVSYGSVCAIVIGL